MVKGNTPMPSFTVHLLSSFISVAAVTKSKPSVTNLKILVCGVHTKKTQMAVRNFEALALESVRVDCAI
jgi:hypothetical protein